MHWTLFGWVIVRSRNPSCVNSGHIAAAGLSKVPALRFLLPAPIQGGPTKGTTRPDMRHTESFDASLASIVWQGFCCGNASCWNRHAQTLAMSAPVSCNNFRKESHHLSSAIPRLALSPHCGASSMLLVTFCLFLSHAAKARAHACGPPNEALPVHQMKLSRHF